MESIVETGGLIDSGEVVVHEMSGEDVGSLVENMSLLSDEPVSPASAKQVVAVTGRVNSDDRTIPARNKSADMSHGDASDTEMSIQSGRSARSARTSTSAASSQSVLTRRVVKKCSNGDLFSGLADAVTGEPVEGRLTCAKTGEVYEGPFRRGRRHGEGGHSNRVDGSKFFGSFRNGDPYEGTLIMANYTYQGRLLVPQPTSKADIFHGPNGTLLHKNGDIYQGGFSHGRYHGKGRERTVSGLNYTGQYKSGKWHGMGDLIVERRANATNAAKSLRSADDGLSFNPDAFRYTYYGEWQHGEREGNGFEKIVFGSKRSSSRSVSVQSSASTSSASKKKEHEERLKKRTATYEGEFHRDRRHGSGILVLPDGTVVQGVWKSGVPSTMAEDGENDSSDPESDTGMFSRPMDGAADRMSRRKGGRKRETDGARWKIDFPNGDKYRGECARAPMPAGYKPDGMRSHLHIDLSSCIPILPHGAGTMTYAKSGDVYQGSFRMGKRHGFGRCILKKSGEEFDGTWVDDLPGEVGGQRLHLFQPLFDCSVASKEQKKHRNVDITCGGANRSEEECTVANSDGDNDDKDGKAEDAAAKASRLTLEGRVASLFGSSRKLKSSGTQKSLDGLSNCSIGSEATPPMANGSSNARVAPSSPEDSLMVEDSLMTSKDIISREERTLSTTDLSTSSS